MTRECYVASLKIAKGKKVVDPKVQLVACTSLNNNLGEAELNPIAEPIKEVKPFQLDKKSSQCTKLEC